MNTYEAIMIYPPETIGDSLTQAKNVFCDLLKKSDGKVLKITELGLRSLGYVLKKHKQGVVVSFEFTIAPNVMDGLNKTLKLSEGFLKFSIFRKPKERVVRNRKKKIKSAPKHAPKVVTTAS